MPPMDLLYKSIGPSPCIVTSPMQPTKFLLNRPAVIKSKLGTPPARETRVHMYEQPSKT